MVQLLVDLVISKKGTPFLIIVTAILHFLSAHFFQSHTFFMLIWTVIGSKLYVNYIGVNLVEAIISGVDIIVSKTIMLFKQHSTEAIREIAINLQEVGASLTAGSGFSSIAHEFSKHKIGLGACASSLTKCSNVVDVLEEAVKISSLLGLETSIVNSTIGRFTTIAGQAIHPMEQHGLEEMEKFIPLIASTAAMADLEFGEIQIGKHMDRFARNTKSAEIISKHIRSIAEATGICKTANWQILNDLNKMVNDLKEDHIWVASTLALQGALFVDPKNYARVTQYSDRVKAASATLRSINLPEIKNNQIVSECNHIIMKAQDYINQIEAIRKTIGIRPLPVGVCIFGESHIGKTEVIDQIVKRVKERLATRPELFGNATSWAKWDANQREEFDSGYCGQEIVYMDDAFQDKQNKDHLMWYTYISSSCVGTIQGIAEQKGLPFRGLLCLTTCNELPTKSIAVSHIAALHNRFPLTYHFKKVRAFEKWDKGGKDFKHLEIKYGSMTDFVANIPSRKNAKGDRTPSDGEFPSCNLEKIVDQIFEKMVENMIFHNLKMGTVTAVPTEMHGPSDDEDEDEIDESYLNEIFGDIPETSHSETQRHVEFAETVEVHQFEQEDSEEEEPPPMTRMPATVTAGTQNDATSNDDVRRSIRIDQLTTTIARDMNNALNRTQFDTIDSLGDWVNFLYREGRPVNRADFRTEEGLHDFLSTLGAWNVHDHDQEAFQAAFLRQQIVKCQDTLGTEYLWGPAFHMGRVLYLVSPNLRNALEYAFLSGWRRQTRRWRRNLFHFITSPTVLRPFAIHAIPIAAEHLLPISITQSGPMMAAVWLRGFTFGFYYFTGIRPFWNTNLTVRGTISNAVGSLQSPVWFIAKSFEYVEKIARRLSRNMMSLLLQLLEYFGIDVQQYWTEISDVTVALLSEVIILGIASILIYVIYMLIKLLFKKEEAIEMHESKNELGKGSKKLQRQKKENRKTLQVRSFQQRCYEDLTCKNNCEEQDYEVEIDDIMYTKIGVCNDKQSFYNEKILRYCFDVLDEDPNSKCCEFVKNKNSHIIATNSDIDDFLNDKNELVSLKRIPIVLNKQDSYGVEIRLNLVGEEEEIIKKHAEYLQRLEHLKVLDWQGEINCRLIDDIYHLKINLVGLTTTIQGLPRKFIQKELKDLSKIAEDIKGLKKMTDTKVDEIFETHGSDESLSLMNSLIEQHQVFMSIADLDDIDSREARRMTYGIGHLDIIIFNAHVYSVGEFIRFWRWKDRKVLLGFQICVVEATDLVRDIGFARIITKDRFRSVLMSRGLRNQCNMMAPMVDRFRSVKPYLCSEKDWRDLTNDQTCLCFLPSANAMAIGRVQLEGITTKLIKTNNGDMYQLSDYIKISQLNLSLSLARKGDCGGLVLSYKDRYLSKIVGFHCGGTASNWFATILREEDIVQFVPHQSEEDPFEKLIVKGTPTDLPFGPACTFLGKYKFKTKPAGNKSLSHWKYSPFFEQFEEQLQPGPLSGDDPRIKIDVPRNQLGEKSLLLIRNSVMCSELPSMDSDILELCIEQLSKEMASKIGNIKTTPSDLEDLLEIGLNGDRENQFCTGMELDKASGIPWNEIPGCTKKKHFLQNNNGYISFLDDMNGQRLKYRIERKLLSASNGERLISLSNSKIKDALIKISAVENAKTRVFHCIPVEKVICDAALFGNFKEAYSQAFLQLNHAIGVNPHSLQWRAISEHLGKHPNVFDMDFESYDNHLHSELMHGAFQIIRNVIQQRAPDQWDNARSILEEESIKTYVVDYDTVYKTERGNKSGEYLTTVINCICNDVLSFYTWIKTTSNSDLSIFRKNVSSVSFGDDKIESVSDEFADKYNYYTAKEVMHSIGHKITPGAKDGIERKFCSLEQAQFLKRGIVWWEDLMSAPLLKRSIESPFVWTQIENSEHEIWYNLVEQTLFEALLHGKIYYNEFREKLSKCNDLELRSAISALISVPYDVAKRKYLSRYYESKTHLCT